MSVKSEWYPDEIHSYEWMKSLSSTKEKEAWRLDYIERKRNKTRERLPKPEGREDFIRETDFIAMRFLPPKVDFINHNLAQLNYDL